MKSLAEALEKVKDHRQRQGLRHELPALLLLMCTGMLCGCGSLQALTLWGKRQEKAFLQLLGFPRGIAPGYGTLQRTAKELDVDSFEGALHEWAEAVLATHLPEHSWQGLSLDGKVHKGSRDGELPGVRLLSLFAHEVGITLSQGAVPQDTNEHKASLPLLKGFTLSHRVVTADAAFMQRDVCCLIRQQHGHYLIVLKENQPDLAQTVRDWFEPFPPSGRISDAVGAAREFRARTP